MVGRQRKIESGICRCNKLEGTNDLRVFFFFFSIDLYILFTCSLQWASRNADRNAFVLFQCRFQFLFHFHSLGRFILCVECKKAPKACIFAIAPSDIPFNARQS